MRLNKLNKFEYVSGVPVFDVQCIMGNGHMGTPSPCEQNDRQTDTTETDMLFLFPRLQFGCGHDFVGKIHFLIITESFIS